MGRVCDKKFILSFGIPFLSISALLVFLIFFMQIRIELGEMCIFEVSLIQGFIKIESPHQILNKLVKKKIQTNASKYKKIKKFLCQVFMLLTTEFIHFTVYLYRTS